MDFETEKIEFKAQFTEEIYKEVIAFANTEGGIIYVGIDNDGNAIGLNNVDEEYTRITNGIRDAIMPDVTMFVRFSIQDNKVVQIAVNEGTNKPYYLKSKGLKSNGVFVRQGSSSAPASPEQIRQMIKESDGDTFEDARSLNQELTFESATKVFRAYNIEFSPLKYTTLGLTNNGLFTNLALLISDQCPFTTKVAVFSDEACTEFRDRKEFGGSLFEQFDECVRYLSLCNKTGSVISGMYRTDLPDYPSEAIREALLNALIHRDYSFSGSILINVTATKIEFISLGGLLPGLSTDDIKLGISQPRNKKLADIFYRLRLIESYGTGIRRIYKLYENKLAQPEIAVSNNAFKINLPNMNAPYSVSEDPSPITYQMKKVLAYLDEHGQMTDSEVESLLSVKKTRAYILMREMCNLHLIQLEGRGVSKIYLPNSHVVSK